MSPDTPADFVKGQFYLIPLADLQSDPNQPRKYLDPQALDELIASVLRHGVLEPILFRCSKLGILYVVAGERRCAAARKAGLVNIPAIYVDDNHAEIALVENLLRQDLTAIEEAEALDRMMRDYNYKQEDLGRMLGKSQPAISLILSLNRLPKEVRDECRADPTVPRYILVEIAKTKQQRGMLTQYRHYKTRKLSKESLKKQSRTKRKTYTEILLASMAGLTGRINKLDMTGWADADRDNLLLAISELQRIVADKFRIDVSARHD